MHQSVYFVNNLFANQLLLLGSKHSIARIPKTRNNVAVFIQVAIDCSRDNRHVWMGLFHPRNTFWGRE
jgi:hypothetical protein